MMVNSVTIKEEAQSWVILTLISTSTHLNAVALLRSTLHVSTNQKKTWSPYRSLILKPMLGMKLHATEQSSLRIVLSCILTSTSY